MARFEGFADAKRVLFMVRRIHHTRSRPPSEAFTKRYGPTDPWRLLLWRLGLAMFEAETGEVLGP